MVRVGIVGAGLAGLACAEVLIRAGHQVALFDKGRGPGGRMSTRRMASGDEAWAFDHGAPWFTAQTDEFRDALAQWADRGLVARWPDPAGDLWVGVPGMNALVGDMAGRHDAQFGVQVTALVHEGAQWRIHAGATALGPFDAVVLAIPVEQAALLAGLHDFAMARAAAQVTSLPCWTGLFAFSRRVEAPDVIQPDDGPIHLAIRNAAKPGRSAEESWVVYAKPAWSQSALEQDKEAIAPRLLDALGRAVAQAGGGAIPAPDIAVAHRWRFAMPRPGNPGMEGQAMWNSALHLGACGDWLAGSGVEAAWLSGRALAAQMMMG